ncbi:calcium/sodium antiporter [Candidatus Woesearchaeota archaeon]|nr:calcium/sodium antiporter [Candidatus Woesearchaeota archaeon]
MILEILLFILGLVILIKGADWLVEHSSHFARALGVSPLIIGLTIVAFGTSLPELIVSLFAAIKGNADISMGNIVGSNIANIGLILGISALVRGLKVQLSTLIYEMPFLLVSAFLFMLLSNDNNLFSHNGFSIGRIDGLIFLVIFTMFMIYTFKSAFEQRGKSLKKYTETIKKRTTPEKKEKLSKDIFFMLLGLAALIIGGRILVDAAVKIAQSFGISEAFIGLTIVAVGTSLPELMTSMVAAWKKEADIALGNVIGSNIFNILFVMGITSLIKPLNVNPSILFVDMPVMILFSIGLLFFLTTNRKLTKWKGAVLLIGYAGYIFYLISGL